MANPVRLNMLICLMDHPRLYVQEVADLLEIQEDVASKNLQVLASGGFLKSKAVSKYLYYTMANPDRLHSEILQQLKSRKKTTAEPLMWTLTALTHERRVSIVSLLKQHGSMEKYDLFFQAQISAVAGRRHLNKLIRREWVAEKNRVCCLNDLKDSLVTVLVDQIQ